MNAAVLRIEDFNDDFDPFTAILTAGNEAHVTDPFSEYDRLLRTGGPVHKLDLRRHLNVHPDVTMEGLEVYTVLGFDACSEVLMNSSQFTNAIYRRNLGITFGESVTVMDGADHARYRRLFQSVFTPKMLAALKPRFQAVVDRLFEKFQHRKQAELVHELALHFPFQFIMDLMDMDVEQRPVFHKIAMAQMCVTFDHDHGVRASQFLWNYLSQLIEERRHQDPESNLVSGLANAEIDGEKLPEVVIVSFFRQLMNAGGDTSYHGFSNILAALFTHPDQLEAIRHERTLIAPAIEEGLRWSAPIGSIMRGCPQGAEVAGVKIPAGTRVDICLAAANRDYTRWQNPHAFDIRRPAQRHIAFGYGPHVCIGQHLGRMELQVALNTILDRLPNVRLDPKRPAPKMMGYTLRGADAVHVIWD